MYLTRRQSLSLLASLPLASLGAVACGSATSGSTPVPDLSIKAAVVNATSVNSFVYYVAGQNGYYDAAGLKVSLDKTTHNFVATNSGPNQVAALIAGEIEIGGGTITEVFSAVSLEPSVRIIGSEVNADFIDIIFSKTLAASLSPTATVADKTAAMVGKKIGYLGVGSATESLLIYLFKQIGKDVHKDATLVTTATGAASLTALSTGNVDALSFSIPVGPISEARGIGKVVISPALGDVPALKGAAMGVFYTLQSVIDAKPQAVQKFIAAIAKAEKSILDANNSATTLTQIETFFNVQAGPLATRIQTILGDIIAPTPTVDQTGYQIAADLHVTAGIVASAPSYSSVVAASTIAAAIK